VCDPGGCQECRSPCADVEQIVVRTRSGLPEQAVESCAIDHLEGFSFGEIQGITSELAGRDEDSPMGLLGDEHTEEFANRRDAHLVDVPRFALHQDPFLIPVQGEIDAAIGAGAGRKFHGESLSTVDFTDEQFEFIPREILYGSGRGLWKWRGSLCRRPA
jgi:hypothetical protein